MKLPAQIQMIIAFRIVDIKEKQIWKGGNPYICCGVKQHIYGSVILFNQQLNQNFSLHV